MKNDDHLESVGLRNLSRSRPVAISFARADSWQRS
jgi:hypothetical protein